MLLEELSAIKSMKSGVYYVSSLEKSSCGAKMHVWHIALEQF